MWYNVNGERPKSADDLDVLDEAQKVRCIGTFVDMAVHKPYTLGGKSSQKGACPEPVEGFIYDENRQQKTQVVLLSWMGRVEWH